MPRYAYLILLAGWIIWMAPFILIKRPSVKAQQVDRRARWGMLAEAVAFALLWQSQFWLRTTTVLRTVLSICFLVLAGVLSWSGTRTLGRQWRVDAGLNEDHALITTGPYRFVRHPIYASMLCMLLGAGLMTTSWPLLLLCTVMFIIGTEVRVRIEDALLASRFRSQFESYRRAVPAYIPFIR
jgi:protein-S-isoprenylcysteine O-methyltransferase Ste14